MVYAELERTLTWLSYRVMRARSILNYMGIAAATERRSFPAPDCHSSEKLERILEFVS